jgi:hypothetical protein
VTATDQTCPSFSELADYWTPDIAPADIESIEAHVFECQRCAQLLATTEQLRSGIVMLARSGNVQAFVTDAVLNRLARDGVRVRSYALAPGGSVKCAVWADDEVILSRLRADFSGVTSVDAEMCLESGEPWAQATDVPVRAGASELLLALPASILRDGPNVPMRLTLRRSATGSAEGILAEYLFQHEGSLSRNE